MLDDRDGRAALRGDLTASPSTSPSRSASVGLIRSAPVPSFLRQVGSRKIVLAVDDRRSPAERTNGYSHHVRRLLGRAAPRSSSSSSAMASCTSRRPCAMRAHVSSTRRRVNTTPEGESRMASNSSSPGVGPLPKPARSTARVASGHSGGPRPTAPRRRRRRRAASARGCGRARPAPSARASAWRRRPRRTPRRTRPGPRRPPRAAAQVVVADGAERLDEAAVDLRLGQRAGSGSTIGGAGGRRSRGNSRVKNVASHFSNCDGGGQHVVGEPGGLGHGDVDDDDEVERVEGLAHPGAVGQRVGRVAALDEHGPEPRRGGR